VGVTDAVRDTDGVADADGVALAVALGTAPSDRLPDGDTVEVAPLDGVIVGVTESLAARLGVTVAVTVGVASGASQQARLVLVHVASFITPVGYTSTQSSLEFAAFGSADAQSACPAALNMNAVLALLE
jgi:hypothetical protein